MDHRGERRLEVIAAQHRPVRGGDAIAHAGRQRRADAIAEPGHLAADGIDLRVGGDIALVRTDVALRFQGADVHLEGMVGLLQRQQLAGVEQDVGVGDPAFVAGRERIGGQRIAHGAEQGAAVLVLQEPLGRADIAVAVMDLAVLDIEAVDHAVAAEPVVVLGVAGLELGVGAGAEQGAPQARRDLADHGQIEVVFAADRGEIARQIGVDANVAVHRLDSLETYDVNLFRKN